jgi:ribosomal protein L16/L10AE
MYQVQMQYIPGNNKIWVARLNPQDQIYEYPIETEAEAKAAELQAADDTGRQYRVVNLSSVVTEE